MTTRHAIVSGRVQGVGFRFFAQRAARETGIRGWVRNLPDGTVETVAEGDAQAVEAYLQRLRNGPGRVTEVRAEEAPEGGFAKFEVTR